MGKKIKARGGESNVTEVYTPLRFSIVFLDFLCFYAKFWVVERRFLYYNYRELGKKNRQFTAISRPKIVHFQGSFGLGYKSDHYLLS